MDIIEVRRALEIFKPEGELVEIRAIGTKRKVIYGLDISLTMKNN